jgi:hypothetical protein
MALGDESLLAVYFLGINWFENYLKNSPIWQKRCAMRTNELSTWEHEEVKAG